jgi:hypothetical protein
LAPSDWKILIADVWGVSDARVCIVNDEVEYTGMNQASVARQIRLHASPAIDLNPYIGPKSAITGKSPIAGPEINHFR